MQPKTSIFSKLEIRNHNNKIDWENIDLNFPKGFLFKKFHDVFDSNSYHLEPYFYSYYSIKSNLKKNFSVFNNDFNIMLYEFIEPSKIIEIRNRIYIEEEDLEPINLDFLPIGICAMNQVLLVGIGESNMDKIFLDTGFKEPRMQFVANDIFEFLKGITIEPKNYGNFSDFSVLYKKWGEDFWRISGEE